MKVVKSKVRQEGYRIGENTVYQGSWKNYDEEEGERREGEKLEGRKEGEGRRNKRMKLENPCRT